MEQRLFAYGRSQRDKQYPTAFQQINDLTELRAILPWFADVPRTISSQLLLHLDQAWSRCFQGISAEPKFKRKGVDSVPIGVSGARLFRIGSGHIAMPKIGAIPAVIHRAPHGIPKCCAITNDAGQWFASVTCEIEIAEPAPSTLPAVGIDRGIALLAADSTGHTVENPKHAENLQPRIVRAQRIANRRKKGSKNRTKAKLKVARLQRKVRRQREHTLHVASKHYAKNHGVVIVETLRVADMTRSAAGTAEEPGTNVAQKRGLNRAILDAGWSRFLAMLRYKVIPEGGRVLEVPAAYSSQTCAECGHVDAASRTEQSVFQCTACGHLDNADLNAARVLLARGLSVLAVESTVTVCGGSAAQGHPSKQKLRAARRGTRRSDVAATG